jgi:hypothetical protein
MARRLYATSVAAGTVTQPMSGASTSGSVKQKSVRKRLVCVLYSNGVGVRAMQSHSPATSSICSNASSMCSACGSDM